MATADFSRDAQFNAPPAAPSGADPGAMLLRNVERLMARRNQQRMRRAVLHAAVWGVGAAALMVLAYRCYFVDGAWWVPALVILASVVAGWRNGLLQRSGPFATALEADRSLELDDRLSSALAFVDPAIVLQPRHVQGGAGWMPRLRAALWPRLDYATSPAPLSTQLVPALVQDAAARSAKLDPRQLYPHRMDRHTQTLLLLSVVFAVFCLMPNLEWFRSAAQRQLATVLQQQGKELEAVVKHIDEKKDAQNDPQTKELTRRLNALALKLQRGRMTKKTALVEMGQLHKDLEKAAKNSESQTSSNQQTQQMEQALQNLQMESEQGQQMQQALAKHDTEKAAQQLEKLADKLEKGDLKPEEREKTAKDLQKAAQALRQQGGQQNESAAQQLEQAAKALRQQNQGGQQKNGQQQGQQGQQQSHGQQSQQGQGKQGQQQGQQQQGQQGGQQGQQQGGQQSGQANAQGGANALRQMAQGLRQGGSASSSSQNLRDMLNKIQQAEKDTGSNSSGQSGGKSGNSQSGDGDKAGEGKGLTPGKDLAVTDPHTAVNGGGGLGPRNNARGSAAGGGVSKMHSNRTGEKRRWQDEWSDKLPKTKGKIERVTGKYGSEGETEQLQTQGEAKNGEVHTPYYKVDESHLRDAEDAISKDAVPPAYKQPVKDYFDSFKSGGK